DRFGRDLLRGYRQVAFVLAVWIVDDDDHGPGPERFNGFLDRCKWPASLARSLRNLQLVLHIVLIQAICQCGTSDVEHCASSAARTTYLPTRSHSRLTRSPAPRVRRFVWSSVNGTICTSNRSRPSAATVRLMPSTAIDPFNTMNGASPDGKPTVSH